MGARFPTRRDDGTFTVVACFQLDKPARVRDLVERLDRFIRERGGLEAAKLLREFGSVPRIEGVGEDVGVVFEGRADAAAWKDWLVMLTSDLAELEGVRFTAFQDQVSDRLHPLWPLNE
ncbi:MAG: hypothetical protein ABR600_06225 [Actinomycetota bacterium]